MPANDPDLIPDPEDYWRMASYAGRVHAVLMALRHLYEPQAAMEWLTSRQRLLGDAKPCELLATAEDARKVQAVIDRITDGSFI